MNPILVFIGARLTQPSSWLGLAAGAASAGASFAAGGMPQTGLIISAIGAGLGGIGAFIANEQGGAKQ